MGTPDGVRCTDLGAIWAVYSPLSGQTLMLNTEAVAMLEVLQDQPGDLVSVCKALAADGHHESAALEASCRGAWVQLVDSGLLQLAVPASYRFRQV